MGVCALGGNLLGGISLPEDLPADPSNQLPPPAGMVCKDGVCYLPAPPGEPQDADACTVAAEELRTRGGLANSTEMLPGFEPLVSPQLCADQDARNNASAAGDHRRDRRRAAAVDGLEGLHGGVGWFDSWRVRFDCWWMGLPPMMQEQFSNCFGAAALHLGSRVDAALGKPAPAPSSHNGAHSNGLGSGGGTSECKWLEEGLTDGSLSLPELPAIPLEFGLPLLPFGLGPEALERIHRLRLMHWFRSSWVEQAGAMSVATAHTVTKDGGGGSGLIGGSAAAALPGTRGATNAAAARGGLRPPLEAHGGSMRGGRIWSPSSLLHWTGMAAASSVVRSSTMPLMLTTILKC